MSMSVATRVLVPTAYLSEEWKVVTGSLYIFSLCALSSMLTRRVPAWNEWRRQSGLQLSLLLVLLSSSVLPPSESDADKNKTNKDHDRWTYVVGTSLYATGVGISSSPEVCLSSRQGPCVTGAS